MSRGVSGPEAALSLPASLLRAMLEQARCEVPRESVGLLFGLANRARRLVRLPNVAADARRRFMGEPRALLAALREADEVGDALVALYHSHPRGPARPSRRDLAEARYEVPTIIVVPRPAVVRAFELRGEGWLERDLVVLGPVCSSVCSSVCSPMLSTEVSDKAPARLIAMERSSRGGGAKLKRA
jgi:proteasome lid subunit RPN8/RPN11